MHCDILFFNISIVFPIQGLADIYQNSDNLQEPILTLLMGQVSLLHPSMSYDLLITSHPVQPLLSARQGHTTPSGVGLVCHCVTWRSYQGGAPGRWGLLGRGYGLIAMCSAGLSAAKYPIVCGLFFTSELAGG